MTASQSTVVGLLLCAFLVHPSVSAAHSMPPSLWVTLAMPHCEQDLDGFSARAKEPYAKWRQKHSDEVAAFDSYEPPIPSAPLENSQRRQLEVECEKVLEYIEDDVRPIDARFVTPDATWKVFVAALRSRDIPVLADCFSPGSRDKWISVFQGMEHTELVEMANSLTGFELLGAEAGGNFQEVVVTRANGRAGIVLFVRTSRGWAISQM